MLDCTFLSIDHQEMLYNFNCSDEPSVEEFLKEKALRLHLANSALTRLFFNSDNIPIGFFTLFSDLVYIPKEHKKNNEWDIFPATDKLTYPAIRLHYIGVDTKYRGNGYGEYLLFSALEICKAISNSIGVNFVSVEALNNSVSFYTKYGFKSLNKSNGLYRNMCLKIDELSFLD